MSPPKPSLATSTQPRLPTKAPDFTKADLVAKIPKHCFVRSTFRSTLYLIADLCGVALLYYLSLWIPVFPEYFAILLWPTYWVFQGGVCTGLWVIAHECGHRAYSDSVLICDIVGLILHSTLLVPYHSWRISHSKHHRSSGDLDKDEVFVPLRLSQLQKESKAVPTEKTSLRILLEIVGMFTVGWWIYLSLHITGRDYGKHTDHFNPKSPLFSQREYWQIVLSDLGIITVIAGLAFWIYMTSFMNVFFLYGVPYLIVNFWLLLYTLLHHTDPIIPRYNHENWNWLMGALTTVDRDYGFLWNTLHHNIGDTHVLHHLFSKIPHYHAKEATEAIKPLLGEYYYQSNEPIHKAVWKVFTSCQYIDDTKPDKALWFGPTQ